MDMIGPLLIAIFIVSLPLLFIFAITTWAGISAGTTLTVLGFGFFLLYAMAWESSKNDR
jgi:hypothetical protein